MKISTSEDYTLCCLDIFNYKASSFKYFTLGSPFTIILAGEGTFFKPFNLNLYDPFLKCLYFAININKVKLLNINDRAEFDQILVPCNFSY